MAKTKKLAGVVAVVLVIAILTAGTFTWYDFSQNALNEFSGTYAEPLTKGVLLWDIFEPEDATDWQVESTVDKVVYVENSGEVDVYVRVKLTEYMDISDEEVFNYSDYISWATGGTVISMADWLELDEEDQTGAFWVLDMDGWAYWAQVLKPESETAHLLDAVTLDAQPLGNFNYTIKVALEAVDADDLDMWLVDGYAYDKYGVEDEVDIATSSAKSLLAMIVAGSGEPGTEQLKIGDTVTMNDIVWSVIDVKDGAALLYANSPLLKMAYATSSAATNSWENSAVRTYLNSTYYDTFDAEDRAKILATDLTSKASNGDIVSTTDNIFLLSGAELISYYSDPDDRALYEEQSDGEYSAVVYWLRSYYQAYNPEILWSGGYVNNDWGGGDKQLVLLSATTSYVRVRPAMWIAN